MKIAVGSDKKTRTTQAVVKFLKDLGYQVLLFGALKKSKADWVDLAKEVALLVRNRKVDEAVLFCWSGTGVAMVASKIPGVRAVTVSEPKIARWARAWDHGNILAMSCFLPAKKAKQIVKAWLITEYSRKPDDLKSIRKIKKLEYEWVRK